MDEVPALPEEIGKADLPKGSNVTTTARWCKEQERERGDRGEEVELLPEEGGRWVSS